MSAEADAIFVTGWGTPGPSAPIDATGSGSLGCDPPHQHRFAHLVVVGAAGPLTVGPEPSTWRSSSCAPAATSLLTAAARPATGEGLLGGGEGLDVAARVPTVTPTLP